MVSHAASARRLTPAPPPHMQATAVVPDGRKEAFWTAEADHPREAEAAAGMALPSAVCAGEEGVLLICFGVPDWVALLLWSFRGGIPCSARS